MSRQRASTAGKCVGDAGGAVGVTGDADVRGAAQARDQGWGRDEEDEGREGEDREGEEGEEDGGREGEEGQED